MTAQRVTQRERGSNGFPFILPEDPGPPPLLTSFGSGAEGSGAEGGALTTLTSDWLHPTVMVMTKTPKVEKLTTSFSRIDVPSHSQDKDSHGRDPSCGVEPAASDRCKPSIGVSRDPNENILVEPESQGCKHGAVLIFRPGGDDIEVSVN